MSTLLTIHEVAEMTRLHEMTIRRYIQQGKLAAVRVGRQVRIPQEAVEDFIEPLTPQADTPASTGKPARGRFLTQDDPLFEILDLGQASQDDLSSDKYRYFSEVFS